MTQTAQPRLSPNVRPSDERDILLIGQWLQEQDRARIPGTFLSNWNLTQDCHQRGELLVYADPTTDEPLAYQWGGLLRPGILEVRYTCRGRGFGRALTEHRLALAQLSDQGLLLIQCTPATSIPFWERMGFTLIEGSQQAYRILPKVLDLPAQVVPAEVRIEFLPEHGKWQDNVPPATSEVLAAGVTPDGSVHLSRRVYWFDALHRDTGDVLVRVTVGDALWYFDKAKYEQAAHMGVMPCINGYRIDRLYPPRRD